MEHKATTHSTNPQTIANKKWQAEHKEHAKYLSDRSRTRSFIRNSADQSDLTELEALISERDHNISARTKQHQTGDGTIPDSMHPCMSIDSVRNTIINGDALKIMRQLPTASVDMVITSPPYNLRNSSGNGMKDGRGGKWSHAKLIKGYDDGSNDDAMPYDEYVLWQRECLEEMMRLIPDTGAIFYNHKWRVQSGLLQDRHEILSGFPVRQVIIWKRKGGINFNPGYFLPTYEVIYLIAKKKFKLAKGANKVGDVWEFGQELKNPHPAPFPVPLIDRIVSSTTANTILDPFMGSGTTALAAMHYQRDYIGIELSKEYCDMARQRIKNEQSKTLV